MQNIFFLLACGFVLIYMLSCCKNVFFLWIFIENDLNEWEKILIYMKIYYMGEFIVSKTTISVGVDLFSGKW